MTFLPSYIPGITSWVDPLPRFMYEQLLFERMYERDELPQKTDINACLCSISTMLGGKRYFLSAVWENQKLIPVLQPSGDENTSIAQVHQCFQLNLISSCASSNVFELYFHNRKLMSSHEIATTLSWNTSENTDLGVVRLECKPSANQVTGVDLYLKTNGYDSSIFIWNAVEETDGKAEFRFLPMDTTDIPTSWEVRVEHMRPVLAYSLPIDLSSDAHQTGPTPMDTWYSLLSIWMLPVIGMVIMLLLMTFWFYRSSKLDETELERYQMNKKRPSPLFMDHSIP